MTKQEKALAKLRRKANRGPGFSNYAVNELKRIAQEEFLNRVVAENEAKEKTPKESENEQE